MNLISEKEAAQALGLSVSRLQKDRLDGLAGIPFVRMGRAFRYSREALAAWIDQEEERRRLTLEALADVDAGHVIGQPAVQAWAESLSSPQPLPVPRG